MSAKKIVFDQEARDQIKNGVKQLAAAVKSTLGPRGRNVIIEKPFGSPTVTKDGVTVAEEIEFENPWENMGAQLVKEVASKTASMAGDGTTTATILAEAILEEGLKNVAAGANPVGIRDGINKAIEVLTKNLEERAIEVQTNKEIEQVGTIASNNDKEIGSLLAQAMEKVGKDGVITVEESKSFATEIEVVDGMQFDRGFISPYFVTEQNSQKAILEDAWILIYEKKLSTLKDFLKLLEKVANTKKPILVIADDVDGEAATTLIVNHLRGVLRSCAIKAPGFGDRRRQMLEDIAVATGGRLLTDDMGIDFTKLDLAVLGKAGKIIVTKDDVTIIEGNGSQEAIKERIEIVNTELKNSVSDYDKERLQERIAKLSGGVAKLKVGAMTEAEMKEKKDRVEDALHATRAAVESGILPGGGVALLRLSKMLANLDVSADEKIGVDIVRRALSSPIKQIALNAGLDGSVVVMKVLEKDDFNYGYNAATETYEDLIASGVVDPAKVTITALRNAASVATLLLTTNVAISSLPEKKVDAGMGGMGGMPM